MFDDENDVYIDDDIKQIIGEMKSKNDADIKRHSTIMDKTKNGTFLSVKAKLSKNRDAADDKKISSKEREKLLDNLLLQESIEIYRSQKASQNIENADDDYTHSTDRNTTQSDTDAGNYTNEHIRLQERTDDAKSETGKENKNRMELYDWIQCFVTALVCGVLIFVFLGRTIGIEGSSMMDTLHDQDRVILYSLLYTPKKGDIVVFQSVNEERFHDVPLVKRVIATEGDMIDIDFLTGNVIVNGRVIDEPYINSVTTVGESFSGPLIIPEGYIFIMGDNRGSSIDSRSSEVGLVDTRYILGRVVFLLLPGDGKGFDRDWSRFGIVT